jgi:sterol desaturase/sphingolipid hydroxylase (fatty acid hydroxylase superfamily)
MRVAGLLRRVSYPVLVAGAGLATYAGLAAGLDATLVTLPLVLVAALAVSVLERIAPYRDEWNEGHDDVGADLIHNVVNVGSNQLGVLAIGWLAVLGVSSFELWPSAWPFWAQLALAAVVAELGFYGVHWSSHHHLLLWRFHAVHHSSTRLYCLNGQRRHPVNHWLEIVFGPGLVALLGAESDLIAVYGTTVVVHLLLQHSNFDYRVGPLRFVLAVAEAHRHHHRKDLRQCRVNYGAFLLLWDFVFGTLRSDREAVAADGVGIEGLAEFPRRYDGQLLFPFRPDRREGEREARTPIALAQRPSSD